MEIAPRVAGRDLCLIADRPTFGAARLLAVLPGVLAVAGRRAIVIDRGAGEDDEATPARLAYLAQLLATCRQSGALLMVSGRVDLALAAGADGVHLPERGLPTGVVRATWPQLLVGRSCHGRAGLATAAAAGADYALLSPVAAPTSKAMTVEPLGIEGFSRCIQGLVLPVLALGGVTPAIAAGLRRAGAAGVATLGDVLGAAEVGRLGERLGLTWDGLGGRRLGHPCVDAPVANGLLRQQVRGPRPRRVAADQVDLGHHRSTVARRELGLLERLEGELVGHRRVAEARSAVADVA